MGSPTAPELEPLRVAQVWVTTGYDSAGYPVRVALEPGELTTRVAVTTSVAVELTRFVLPTTSTRQAICLRAGTDAVGALADCVGPAQPFLVPDYRPSARRVTFFQLPGETLAPDTLYRLTIYPPTTDSEYGLRAFDGEPLERVYQFDFRTAAGPSDGEELGPTAERYCEQVRCVTECREPAPSESALRACIAERCGCMDADCFADGDVAAAQGGLLGASCAGAGCHGLGINSGDEPWGTGDAAMGLDLSTPEAIAATAIGRVAHQTETGEHAAVPELAPSRFGRAMPIISPAAPGASYLVYKATAQLLNHPPAHQLDPDFLAELARLRAVVVPGLGMPPADSLTTVSADPLSKTAWERLQRLEAWVAYGAVTHCP